MIVVLVGGSCDGRRIEWVGRHGGPVIHVASLARMQAQYTYAAAAADLQEMLHTHQHETYRILHQFDGYAVAVPDSWDPLCGMRELIRGYHEERQRCG